MFVIIYTVWFKTNKNDVIFIFEQVCDCLIILYMLHYYCFVFLCAVYNIIIVSVM